MQGTPDSELYKRAEQFADSLTDTLRSVLPDAPEYTAEIMTKGNQTNVGVAIRSPETGRMASIPIPLYIGGNHLLDLEATYHCCWDQRGP